MKEYFLDTNIGSCRIMAGESLKNLENYLPYGKNIVITDANVRRLHGHLFSHLDCIEIGIGEKEKTLETVEKIYRRFLDLEVDRSSFVIGIGGGIVSDVSAFAASTFMRGLSFGLVPTTLLAQVDASIGGKTGVNFRSFKNLIGTFRQPSFVLTDPALLLTLPEREVLCGLAEIVKHAVIKSPSLFDYLERNGKFLFELDRQALFRVVDESIRIKTDIVRTDAIESGERRLLNFGHTFGHALEKEEGISHGEAVSIGMVLAARISAVRGMIPYAVVDRIESLLLSLGLPTEPSTEWNIILSDIRRDKKRQGGDIHFVFLSDLGRAKVMKVSYEDLEKNIDDMRQSQ